MMDAQRVVHAVVHLLPLFSTNCVGHRIRIVTPEDNRRAFVIFVLFMQSRILRKLLNTNTVLRQHIFINDVSCVFII